MSSQAAAETLKPFVLGDTPPGDLKQVADAVKLKVTAAGFEIVGSYSPFANAVVICVTNNDLKTTAAKVPNGGFGAAQRVSVTDVKGKIQVAYVNPAFLGTAYGMGKLESVSSSQDRPGRREGIRFGKRYSGGKTGTGHVPLRHVHAVFQGCGCLQGAS